MLCGVQLSTTGSQSGDVRRSGDEGSKVRYGDDRMISWEASRMRVWNAKPRPAQK